MNKLLPIFLVMMTLAGALVGNPRVSQAASHEHSDHLAGASADADHERAGSPDCEQESCRSHRCHLGHCFFTLVEDVALTYVDSASPQEVGSHTNTVLSFDLCLSRTRPPC